MKYTNLIDNFVMVAKFDECRCLPINLKNLDSSRLYYHYGQFYGNNIFDIIT